MRTYKNKEMISMTAERECENIDRNEYSSIEFIHEMKNLLGIEVSETETVFEQCDAYSITLTGMWELWKYAEKVGRQKCRKDYKQ